MEEAEAAEAAGYRLHEFFELEPELQAVVVAKYRVSWRMQAMQSWWSSMRNKV